jgi:hypothetical protein
MRPTTTTTDLVTGSRVELTLPLAVSIDRLWPLLVDIPGIGAWSPECIGATWVDETRPAGAPGARFAARNRFPDGVVRSAEGVVTIVDPMTTFAWDVLDEEGRPGSRWRYDLRHGATSDVTIVHHRFEHGPGNTGLRAMAAADPAAMADRLGQLGSNMAATLSAMQAAATAVPDGRRLPG